MFGTSQEGAAQIPSNKEGELGQPWGGSSDSRVVGSEVVRGGGPGVTDMTKSTSSNPGEAREGLGVGFRIFT